MLERFFKATTKNEKTMKGKVVSFLNQKGGVGKTTLTFNMAHALARKGHKVLCIDMDPQSNLSLLFDAENATPNMFHLLVNSVRELKALHTPATLMTVMKKCSDNDNLFLLPAGQELSGLELTVAGISGARQLILKRFLEKNNLLADFDFIIIDGPPTLGLLVVNILCASHGVLIPFRPDQFSRSGLKNFYEVLANIEDMGITETPKILGHIPNLMESRRKQEEEDFNLIKDELQNAKIFQAINNKVQLVKSGAMKKSVFDFKSQEYHELQGQFSAMADFIHQELN